MSGSAAIRLRNVDHRLLGVEQALVHVDVDDLRAVFHLLARDRERGRVVAGRDQLAELGRAGDVGALADIDERNFRREREGLEPRQPQLPRHLGNGARRLAGDGLRRWRAMCSGVVPQQPPTMFTRPASANSPSSSAMYSGLSS